MGFNVASEVGELRQVIVHRPGLELSRLTPRNVGELRADDFVLPRCPTTCSSGTTPAGSMAESRSIRWPSPPGSARH
jgi:hypothetical protein